MKLLSLRSAALVLSAGLLSAGPVLAQSDAPPPSPPGQNEAGPPPPPPDGGPRRGGPEHRVEMLQHSLNLSPDQTTQVRTLFASERSRMEAVHANSALAPEDRRSQMMAIHQDTDGKMHTLLTPEQATKYDAMEARMRERRQGGGEPPPPPQGPGER